MTLFELFGLLRKHLAIVIILPVVCALAVFAAAMVMPDEYTASTTMYVLTRNDGSESSGITQQDLNAGQMLTNDVATLIKSDRIKADVAQDFGLYNLDDFKIDVTSATTTRVLTLSVTSRDAEMAAKIANAIVSHVSKVASQVMAVESVNVIDTAATPLEPSGPRRLLYTVVGAMAGLFIAVAIVVVMDMVDTRVRDGAEVEEIVGVPVVGHFSAID